MQHYSFRGLAMASPAMALPDSCSATPSVALPRANFLPRPCPASLPFANSSKHAATTRKLGPNSRHRVTMSSWFKFGKNGLDAESAGIYASQGRDDFSRDDVALYFDYTGMLAVEGNYDSMEELLKTGIHPVDVLLMLAATEGDRPKIEELLRAGALCTVKDTQGRTALDRASDDEIRELIRKGSKVAV